MRASRLCYWLLGWFSILLPEAQALTAVRERVEQARVPFRDSGGALRLADPSGIELVLEVAGGGR